MKYKMHNILDRHNMISHIFLSCAWDEVLKPISEKSKQMTQEERENREIDITLTIEGIEVDPKKWYDGLWERFGDYVKEEATKIVQEQTSDKFRDLRNKMCDFEKSVDSWIDNMNWNVPEIFRMDEE